MHVAIMKLNCMSKTKKARQTSYLVIAGDRIFAVIILIIRPNYFAISLNVQRSAFR